MRLLILLFLLVPARAESPATVRDKEAIAPICKELEVAAIEKRIKPYTLSAGGRGDCLDKQVAMTFDAFHQADSEQKKICSAAHEVWAPGGDSVFPISQTRKGFELKSECLAGGCRVPPVTVTEKQLLFADRNRLSKPDEDPAWAMAQMYSSHIRSPIGKKEKWGDIWYYWEYPNPSNLREGVPALTTSISEPNLNPGFAAGFQPPMELNKKYVIKKCYFIDKVFGSSIKEMLCNTLAYKLVKLQSEPSTYALVTTLINLEGGDNEMFSKPVVSAYGRLPNDKFKNLFEGRTSITVFKATPNGALMYELSKTPITTEVDTKKFNEFRTRSLINGLVEADHEQFRRRLNLDSAVPEVLDCVRLSSSWQKKNPHQ